METRANSAATKKALAKMSRPTATYWSRERAGIFGCEDSRGQGLGVRE
jgi:hypothetical protein